MESLALNKQRRLSSRRVSATTEDLSLESISRAQHNSTYDSNDSVPNPLVNTDETRNVHEVRINLRKRPAKENENTSFMLATCNSALLHGIFQDIAKASGETHDTMEQTRFDNTQSVKRSRVTISRSISRCTKSFKCLNQVLHNNAEAPSSVNQPWSEIPHSQQKPFSYRQHFVSGSSTNQTSNVITNTTDVGKLAFPHLPATVSNPSCSDLGTRLTQKPGQPLPATETNDESAKESYGWFVSMEDEEDIEGDIIPQNVETLHSANSSSDLAFTAVTAPKRVNYDAEIEWAKAADTVDDVLGCFF
eukprot:CAMPEP_0202446344 /NCGR_PEP_ID=MMETSP1360-20130828/4857_1 /ASSEMBLY_ACC=CAM_ASM_000848 /TAXON_ID=515479 /ORGANISM="Licmophora paradoxa, Strain CCMP2313" /LENGTH=304 /DNA_ID=CAMNT_0049062791 /DNA_START=40 /DNA_END=954 /DNA_ORIENTATION=-